MGLKDLFDPILRKPNEGYASFALDRPVGDGPDRFTADATYIEIRLSQMHLRDRRKLWREFVPLATVVTELQFGNARPVVPFVVGPELLAAAPNRDEGELVEFYNLRVAGPFPYAGDDVVLFAALSAMESANWAKRALSMLGTVATAFDVTRMSGYLDVAGALTDALQGLLGMNEVEQRVAVHRAFSTPPDRAGADAPQGALKPAFQVFVDAPSQEFPPDRVKSMTIDGGRLHENGRPFTDADFMVLEVIPSATRPDLTKFDFHRLHWREAEMHAIDGRKKAAWSSYAALAKALVMSDDIALTHREALLDEYANKLEAQIARRERIFRGGRARGLEGAPRERLGEDELSEAIMRRRPAARREPNQLLADAEQRVLSVLE